MKLQVVLCGLLLLGAVCASQYVTIPSGSLSLTDVKINTFSSWSEPVLVSSLAPLAFQVNVSCTQSECGNTVYGLEFGAPITAANYTYLDASQPSCFANMTKNISRSAIPASFLPGTCLPGFCYTYDAQEQCTINIQGLVPRVTNRQTTTVRMFAESPLSPRVYTSNIAVEFCAQNFSQICYSPPDAQGRTTPGLIDCNGVCLAQLAPTAVINLTAEMMLIRPFSSMLDDIPVYNATRWVNLTKLESPKFGDRVLAIRTRQFPIGQGVGILANYTTAPNLSLVSTSTRSEEVLLLNRWEPILVSPGIYTYEVNYSLNPTGVDGALFEVNRSGYHNISQIQIAGTQFCVGPDGQSFNPGEGATYYQNLNPAFPQSCVGEYRSCEVTATPDVYALNGSATFIYPSCANWQVGAWSNCGTAVGNCVDQTRSRVCTDALGFVVSDVLCHVLAPDISQACQNVCTGQCGPASTSFANNVGSLPTPYCSDKRSSDPSPAVWPPVPGGSYAWSCGNLGFGDTVANCSATIDNLPACGSDSRAFAWNDNTFGSNLCSQGVLSTAVPILSAGSSAAWSCSVNGRGTTANCAATRDSVPQCGTTSSRVFGWDASNIQDVTTFPASLDGTFCAVGLPARFDNPSIPMTSVPPSGDPAYRWQCVSAYGAIAGTQCSATRTVQPQCGPAANLFSSLPQTSGALCTVGTASRVAPISFALPPIVQYYSPIEQWFCADTASNRMGASVICSARREWDVTCGPEAVTFSSDDSSWPTGSFCYGDSALNVPVSPVIVGTAIPVTPIFPTASALGPVSVSWDCVYGADRRTCSAIIAECASDGELESGPSKCCSGLSLNWEGGNWVCRSPPVETCFDGIQNQDETGVDCGGSFCAACPVCVVAGDCPDVNCNTKACNFGVCDYTAVAPVCPLASATTCGDSILPINSCGACAGTGTFCASGSCSGGVCVVAPTCSDGIQNQGEGGVDCDGPCAACVACTPATADTDCDDADTCTTESCPAGTCVNTPVPPVCPLASAIACGSTILSTNSCGSCIGDGTFCATGTCSGGICVVDPICNPANATIACADGNSCTTDTCPAAACVNTPIAPVCPLASTIACGDSILPTNSCGACVGTGTFCASGSCSSGVCVVGPVCDPGNATIACADGNSCTTESCPAGSCVNTPIAPVCPLASTVACGSSITPTNLCGSCVGDGTFCSGSDVCTSGVCIPVVPRVDGACATTGPHTFNYAGAPIGGYCSSGNASSNPTFNGLTITGQIISWDCAGSGGGTTASCSSSKPPQVCTANSYQSCNANAVTWFDSCNVPGSVVQACAGSGNFCEANVRKTSAGCSGAACVNNTIEDCSANGNICFSGTTYLAPWTCGTAPFQCNYAGSEVCSGSYCSDATTLVNKTGCNAGNNGCAQTTTICDYGCSLGACNAAPTCSDGILNQGELGIDCGGPCAGNITYDYTLVLGGPATGPHECTFVFADGTVILAGLFAGPPNYFTIGTRPGLLSTYSCNPGAQYEDVVVSTNACS